MIRTRNCGTLMISFGIVIWIVTILVTNCKASPEIQNSPEYDYGTSIPKETKAPIIKPTSSELILESGLNYTLECESNEPITWRSLAPLSMELNQTASGPTSEDTQYKNVLHLNDVTAEYVGYFYCIKEIELIDDGDYDKLVEAFKASKIYIFVNDTEVLLVPTPISLIYARQHEDFVIPCKPTMPHTLVEVVGNGHQIYSNESFSRYDPKRGFILQMRKITQEGEYKCTAQDSSQEISFLVIYNHHEPTGPKTTNVPTPQISSHSQGHAIEGASLNLTCIVDTSQNARLFVKWETPSNAIQNHRIKYTKLTIDFHNGTTQHVGKSILTIAKAQKSDSGLYKCIIEDLSGNTANNKYLMTILKNGESYINMSEPNNYYTIKTNESKNILMNVNYQGFPTPSFKWYAPGQQLIQPNAKYEINRTNSSISLHIKNIRLIDSGEYILKALNGIEEKELKFNLLVKAKPQVSIENVYIQPGEEARVLCKTHAYPLAKLIWNYIPCNITPNWPSCESNAVTLSTTNLSDIERNNELTFNPVRPGKIQCTAINIMGSSSSESYVLIADIADNMTVFGIDEDLKIARGDKVSITCAALAYYYTPDLRWFKDDQMIRNSTGIQVLKNSSHYSYRETVVFKNIGIEHAGSYECRAGKNENSLEYESRFLTIDVNEPSAPSITETNLNDQHKFMLGDSLEFFCKAVGIPKPIITWFKDGKKLNTGENIKIIEVDTILKIPYIKPTDQGSYKCVASNRLGNAKLSSKVMITNLSGWKPQWVIVIIGIIGILIISLICMSIRFVKEGKAIRQMKLAGLANFEEGALEQINPEMSLDEQADLLPYDRRFEFPRQKLKLGKILGSGAFGVVLKAHAEGIIPEERETVVAVKMVKRTADNDILKALVSELKIMVHLGQHLNVVNLLGAITKNIAQREIMLIVEYCRLGNVQNFLLRNRKGFVDQINPITDAIDPSIVEKRFSSTCVSLNRNSMNYNRSESYSTRPTSSFSSRKSSLNDYQFDGTVSESLLNTIPEGDDQMIVSNSIYSNFRPSFSKPETSHPMSVTTSDLVSWAFQVTRGMDYLCSRKVLHGDLAARNILLCENNVVKICDFGLARSLYKNENYKKQHKSLLPVKWLALESLSDQIFNTYTDIWSFGVVLWEFFSLATVPYVGIDTTETLYSKLKNGYRMQKPPYANQELYDIMLQCWSVNPQSRPLFHELEKKFSRLLGEEHYVDLNERYLKINNEMMQQSGNIYLQVMESPNEMAPLPPRYYENGMILPEPRIESSENKIELSPKRENSLLFYETFDEINNESSSECINSTGILKNKPISITRKNFKNIEISPEEIFI